MSRLEELIEKLCPDGVEYKTLKDVAEYRRGSFPQPYTNPQWYGGNNSMPFVQVADMHDDDFLLAEETKQRISEVAQPKSIFVEKGTILVSIQGTIGRVAITQYDCYVDRTIAIFYNIKEHNLDKKFFSYVLKQKFEVEKQYARGSTLKTITKEEFSAFTIPVPPLEVQSEIVRILDNFTELTAELTEKLTDEYKARKKQYEYYRELILDKNTNIEWRPLLEVSDTFTGLTYKPTDTASQGTIVLRSSNIKERRLVFDDNVYVQMDNIPERAIVKENDILICVRNGSKALIGKAAMIPKHDQIMAFGAFMTILRPKKCINPKYLFFVWQSPRIQNMIHGESGMPINQITKKMLEQIVVPLPPLEEQQRIVDILDRFDKLCNDISESLPAEIEARQKQYEYYRDRLLTFKEKA